MTFVPSKTFRLVMMAIALVVGTVTADRAAAEDPPTPAVVPKAEPTEAEQEAAAAFNRELRTVEEDVGHLKERVFRSKATLEMLKELILEGVGAGARVSVWHVNEIGGAYSIEAAQYFFDGRNVFTKTEADGSIDSIKEVEVYQGNVNPGKHTIQVTLSLRGKGFKVFSYLRSYQFRVQSSYELLVDEGQTKTIRVLSKTRSGLHSFTDRPVIEYAEQAGSLE